MTFAVAAAFVAVACGGGRAEQSAQPTQSAQPAQSTQSARPVVYDPGVSEKEIVLVTIQPVTGGAALAGAQITAGLQAGVGRANESGVNGRKLKLIVKDSALQPQQGLAMARQAVEEDKAFAVIATAGQGIVLAIWDYLEQQKVPQLITAAGTTAINDPKGHPMTTVGNLLPEDEAGIFWQHMTKTYPNAKLGIIYQNDALGQPYLNALQKLAKEGNTNGVTIAATQSVNATDTDISNQLTTLRAAGIGILVSAIQAPLQVLLMKFKQQTGWRVPQYVNGGGFDGPALGNPPADVLEGVYGSSQTKLPDLTPDDSEVKTYLDAMKKYSPDAKPTVYTAQGYAWASLAIEIIKRAGDPPTRAAIQKTAEALQNFSSPMYVGPVSMSSTSHAPVRCGQMVGWSGGKLKVQGEPICTK